MGWMSKHPIIKNNKKRFIKVENEVVLEMDQEEILHYHREQGPNCIIKYKPIKNDQINQY